jgi:hypothetical protein
MTPTLTYSQLIAFKPCEHSLQEAVRKIDSAQKWAARAVSAAEAREAGVPFDDILWVAAALAQTDEDVRRRLQLWMADCAAHVLSFFESFRPSDTRPRNAIHTARAFAQGVTDTAARAAAVDAAWDAARAAAEAAARDAARAAAGAAAWAAASRAAARAAAEAAAEAVARDAAEAAAWVAARAAAGAAAGDATWAPAWSAEKAWQFDRLIEWLSDPEPDEWPLPARAQDI